MKHWQEIWQRPVVRAVTLGIGVVAVYLVGNNFFTVEDVPPAFSETVAPPKVTGVQPVVFPGGDKGSLRDPFTGAKEKTSPEKEENAGLLSKNKMLNIGTEKKPSNPIKTTPVLTGVLQGPQCSQVLLQLGEEQAVIQVGGWIGEYEVKSIEPDRVLLNGPAGEFFLVLQQMNRQQEK
jgi:hypothetical protein